MCNQMSHRASVRQSLLACLSVLQDSRTKVAVLFTAAVTLSFLVTNGNVAAGPMFQSPPSPVEPPPAAPVQAENAAPAEQGAPTSEVEAPAGEQGAPTGEVEAPAGEQTAPTSEVEAPAGAVTPVSEQEAPLEPAPEPPPAPEPVEPRVREVRPNDIESDTSSNLILDQAEFIDSVVVSFAYFWLCCGVALILVIPLIFLFLQIRGRSKLYKEGL
jgi:hypothetical protein